MLSAATRGKKLESDLGDDFVEVNFLTPNPYNAIFSHPFLLLQHILTTPAPHQQLTHHLQNTHTRMMLTQRNAMACHSSKTTMATSLPLRASLPARGRGLAVKPLAAGNKTGWLSTYADTGAEDARRKASFRAVSRSRPHVSISALGASDLKSSHAVLLCSGVRLLACGTARAPAW